MNANARERRRLLAALERARDARQALAAARRWRVHANDRAAAELYERFRGALRGGTARLSRLARGGRTLARFAATPYARAVAQRMAGLLAHLRGQPRAARAPLERAASSLAACGRWLEAGDTYRTLVDVAMHLDLDTAARAYARRAQACYARARHADPRRRGSLEMNVGNLYHRRDRFERALEAYTRARGAFRRYGERWRWAEAEYNRGNALAALDRTSEARGCYERALRAFRAHGLDTLVAQSQFALGELDLVEGRFESALERLAQAREQHARLGDGIGAAHCELQLAETLLRLNRPADALGPARRALAVFRRRGMKTETAAALAALAGAALRGGRPAAAARRLRDAIAIHRRCGNPVAGAKLETELAHAECRRGAPEEAERILRRARRVFRSRGLRIHEARALLGAAEAAFARGELAVARRRAWGALGLLGRRAHPRLELLARFLLGKIEERAGRRAEAYRQLRLAEARVERLRRGLLAEENRLAFAADKIELYEALILDRLRRGTAKAVREALRYAERCKARALAEALAAAGEGPETWIREPPGRMLAGRLTKLEQALAVAESRLEDARAPRGLRAARARRLDTLTDQRLNVLRRLGRVDPQAAQLVGAAPPDPELVMARLDARELVLEYVEAGGWLHLFAITREDVQAFPWLVRRGEVEAAAERLRFLLGKGALGEEHLGRFGELFGARLRAALERFYGWLLAPVEDRLEGRHVRIVPHGPLHALPFHAFEREGRSLVERATVSYVPSLSVVALLADRAAASTGTPVVLGVPDRAAPAIADEVARIRRRFPAARILCGSRASWSTLAQAGRRAGVLHVASHGFYSGARPWDSALRLGDSWISLRELYTLPRTAELVVLSGCETGRGTVYSGDEWVGLVRAFLRAGARAVVAALWEVHDRSASVLMDAFYGELAAGRSVAEALAGAQRALRRQQPLPLRWAPFIVVGDPRLRLAAAEAA